jgi:NAD(P)-dependent dehydrogenase (short-subunit alcohol dehydrogenase family)
MTNERPLAGRVALVTGGARGQGRSHSVALARAGAAVALVDVPGPMASVPYDLAVERDLDEAVESVIAEGVRAIGLEADVRSRRDIRSAIAQAEAELGPIDVLIANAGICCTGPLVDVDEALWSETIDTNLGGVLWAIQAVVPGMVERGYGRIVATASMAGRGGTRNLSAYSASKWGVIGLVKCAALEVAGTGVTVNAVCPAAVKTPMVLHDTNYRLFCPDIEEPTMDDAIGRFRRMSPLGEAWLEPEDVSREVLHLVLDRGLTTGLAVELGLGGSANRV